MWLPLAEYSLKHKVSISTLRRKIKAEDIQYRLDDGKYFILDQDDAANGNRPSLNSEPTAVSAEADHAKSESVITAANRLLADLKKAYTQVLQDKELQIVSLKEEIADLKTLVKILESENDRHRSVADREIDR